MILTIDCGNTRLKWALFATATTTDTTTTDTDTETLAPVVIAQASLPLSDIVTLNVAWRGLPRPQAIVIANVAGGAVRASLEPLLARWPATAQWLVASAAACGVSNRYEQPAQLGADRWAAMIGAWGRCRSACLVVSAGTATTIDSIGADGVFLGGRIVAGVDLMKKALAANTAGLPLQQGRYAADPRNTADAIESGCLEAQAGAIERCHARLPPGAACLITGGAAAAIAARLTIRASVVDNLALEGLLRIAQGPGPA